MTKEFIPYQQALELKELGFDEECFAMFMKDSFKSRCWCKNSEFEDKVLFTSAPTFSQAFRWFRERYRLCCQFSYYHISKWGFEILEFTDLKITPNKEVTDFNKPRTYEEAELECLIKLIEIVKDGKGKSNS